MKTSELFNDIDQKDLKSMITCLGGVIKNYKKEAYILMAGDTVDFVGILLSGKVQIIKEDFGGNRHIIAEFSEGDLFGEAFACAGIKTCSETVQAITDCEIMMIKFDKIVSTCSNACSFHSMLIANMLKIIAQKNIDLNSKMEIISQRTTREKLMTYLLSQADKAKNKDFDIPFSRNELADYLCVERSAMSREMSKMRDEGILEFERSNFKLLNV